MRDARERDPGGAVADMRCAVEALARTSRQGDARSLRGELSVEVDMMCVERWTLQMDPSASSGEPL